MNSFTNWQTWVVGLLFAAALYWMIRRLRKGTQGEAGCSKCDKNKA